MNQYYFEIESFIKENFTVSDPDKANYKCSAAKLLDFLFKVFPNDCISETELHDILTGLGHKRYTWIEEFEIKKRSKKKEQRIISKKLCSGFALHSVFNLSDDVFEIALKNNGNDE